MSMAMRDSGCAIMKMISSTSRMSIIGTAFGSAVGARRPLEGMPAMLLLLLAENARQGGLGNRSQHLDTRAPRRLHRLLDLAELELTVGFEVQDLVPGTRRELRAQMVL